MSFLAPIFLLSALAIALPFWLHRLQSQSADRRPFSSTMLLETAERQVHVRKKLKYRLLLAARVAMLLLLALVFAKPVWTRALPGRAATPTASHIILIDTSASMSRNGLADAARREAIRSIDTVQAGDLMQLVTADDRLSVVSTLSADKADHRRAVAGLEASALRLDFGTAMSEVDRLAEKLPPPVKLHFISDFQDSAMPARFADLIGKHVAELIPHRLDIGDRPNWRIEFVRSSGSGVSVGVIASSDADNNARLELLVNNERAAAADIDGSGRSTHDFENLPLAAGDNRLTVRIIADDDFAIDNDFYQVLQNTPPVPVPLITAKPGGRPATYLAAALQADPTANYRIATMLIGDADFRTLSRYRWAVIDDLGAIDGALAAVMAAFVENGGNLLAFMGHAVTAGPLPVSGHTVRPTAVGADDNEFLAIGQIDTTHPILAKTTGWQDVNVTRNLVVDIQGSDQVLMRLEDTTPMLLEWHQGRGKMLLSTAGLDNDWNDLPIRPVFVSFMVEAARYLSGVEASSRAYTTGDALSLSFGGSVSGQVIDPDGATVLSLADTTRAQQVPLEKPGFYEVYTQQGDYLVAVNVDARESAAEATEVTLQRWVDSMRGQAERRDGFATQSEPAPLELWHVLLFILALLVIGEPILGNLHLKTSAQQ